MLRDPLGALGASLVVLFVLSAALAPLIAPYEPNALDVPARLQGPSLAHLLGTDHLGRDVLSRVLYGGRIALGVALTAVGLSLVAGILLGLIAGYGPRWLDNLLLLLFDSVRAFPVIMFALAVITVVGPSLQTVILVVVVDHDPALCPDHPHPDAVAAPHRVHPGRALARRRRAARAAACTSCRT